VEGNASGGSLPNRVWQYNGQPTTLDLTVLSWEDLGGGTGTAAPNVTLLDNAFYMPQLNRTRRIWVYLPPDYATSTWKTYPVLYMHDGQNLFNSATAAFGSEWEVDESLNDLHAAGNHGCIVVGIDNDGAHRFNEYSPWVNAQYGGGEGDLYVDFIIETLKPHIDSLYRTQSGRTSTGIMGSSLGGLISMYAFSERQDVFGKAGIFSPAFWFAGSQPAQHTAAHPPVGPARVYFLAGGAEPASVAQNMHTVADAMLDAGFSTDEQLRLVQPGGEHSEWFWAQEFPAAYVWLFPETTVSSTQAQQKAGLEVFPNPAMDVVRFSGAPAGADLRVQFVSPEGMVVRDTSARADEAFRLDNLSAGMYTLRIWINGQPQPALKLVKSR
jgi:metallo-beta-lactamase class B